MDPSWVIDPTFSWRNPRNPQNFRLQNPRTPRFLVPVKLRKSADFSLTYPDELRNSAFFRFFSGIPHVYPILSLLHHHDHYPVLSLLYHYMTILYPFFQYFHKIFPKKLESPGTHPGNLSETEGGKQCQGADGIHKKWV